jgi:enoyl-CoA hydratase
MSAPATEGIRVDRSGAVGRIVLARPSKRNALDRAMADELFAALGQLESDPTVRVSSSGPRGPTSAPVRISKRWPP